MFENTGVRDWGPTHVLMCVRISFCSLWNFSAKKKSLYGWVRIFVKYNLLRSVPQPHLEITGNPNVLFIIIVQGCCFLPRALVSCVTNQTNTLLSNDIKRVREFILCFISSVATFILLLFTEHTLELHDFAHLLSYFTSELLLPLIFFIAQKSVTYTWLQKITKLFL